MRTAAPLILVLAGIALSSIPGLGDVELEPEIILEVILPPLLFAAAVSMPAMSFRRELPSISGLAVLGLAVVLAVRAAWMAPQLWYVASRARRGHDMQPRIERMQQRLETSRRLTEQQLEGWEKVQERLEGIESPTHQQLSAAWRSVLQEMADQGDDLALRRLEMHEKAVALQETDPIERGDSEAWRRRYEHLASGLENGDTTDGDATDGDANAPATATAASWRQ